MRPLIVIPARLAATRLPDKPLAEIAGLPMIVHVWRRAVAADIGPVVVACGDAAIAAAVEDAGGRAVITDPALASGSDRVHAALAPVDPEGIHDVVVNLQGDLPTIEPAALRAVLAPLDDAAVDVATLVAPLGPGEMESDHVVKAVCDLDRRGIGPVRRFTRAAVADAPDRVFHHIGVYGYRRAALGRFVELPPSANETQERLEQLRAVDAGMRFAAARVDSVPFGVDTPADLDRARRLLGREPATSPEDPR